MGKSKSVNDWLLEEFLDFILGDVRQKFYLYLFGKIVDSDDEKLLLTNC